MASDVGEDLKRSGSRRGLSWDCLGTLDFNPSLQIASQSSLDCSEAAGLVSSIYVGHQLRSRRTDLIRKVTDIIRSEVIQSLCNLNLLVGVKECIGKLLPFSQGALDDLKTGDVAEEVTNRLVWISRVRMWVLASVNSGIAAVTFERTQYHGLLTLKSLPPSLTAMGTIDTGALSIRAIHLAVAILRGGAHG